MVKNRITRTDKTRLALRKLRASTPYGKYDKSIHILTINLIIARITLFLANFKNNPFGLVLKFTSVVCVYRSRNQPPLLYYNFYQNTTK